MRLSDVLHSRVLDMDGVVVGRVHDVRLVQDGPLQGLVGAAFRIDGLLVGGSVVSVRLGFHRANVRGPWPLVPLFRRLERRVRFVSWSAVVSCDVPGGDVVLSCRAADLGPMPSAAGQSAS